MAVVIKNSPPSIMTTKEAAAFVGFSESYLNQDRWRANATGTPPVFPFIRIGRSVRYRRDDLAEVLAARTVTGAEA